VAANIRGHDGPGEEVGANGTSFGLARTGGQGQEINWIKEEEG